MLVWLVCERRATYCRAKGDVPMAVSGDVVYLCITVASVVVMKTNDHVLPV